MAKSNPADRRRFARIACPPDASARLRAGTSAKLLDLGLGGALVESSSRLTPGSVNATLFVSPEIAFRARAHIVRAFVAGVEREDGGNTLLIYRAGLEFGPMSATEAGTLGNFVSAAMRMPSAVPIAAPEQTVSIRFPPGWTVTRRQDAVIARAPEPSRFVLLGAPQPCDGQDLGEIARASMQHAGFAALHGQAARINGMEAWVGFYKGTLRDAGSVIVEAAHVKVDDRMFLIAGIAPFSAYESVRHEFFATINSFGSQSDADGVEVIAAPSPRAATDAFDLAAVPALSVA
jgi:hypothetical protein